MSNDPLAGEGPDDGRSIEDRAADGEHERDEPQEEPVRGDHQLSLNLGAVSKVKKVEEATISLSAAERPIDGLLEVDTEYDLLVRVRPKHYETRPIRKDGATRAWKQRQPVSVISVKRMDAEAVISESFAELLGRDEKAAAALLDELREFVSTGLRAAA